MKNIFRLFITTIIILSVSVSTGYADTGYSYLYFENDFESGEMGNMLISNAEVTDATVDNGTYGKVVKITNGYCCTNYSVVTNNFASGEFKDVLISVDVMFETRSNGNLRLISSEQIGSTKNGMIPVSFTTGGKVTSTYADSFTNKLNWYKYSLFSYSLNEWYNVKVKLDLDEQTFDMSINGDAITEGTAIVTDSGTPMIDMIGARVNFTSGTGYVDNYRLYVPHSCMYDETGLITSFENNAIKIDAIAVGEESAVLFAASYVDNALVDIQLVDAQTLDDILFAQYSCDIEPGMEYRFFLFNNTSEIRPLTPHWEYYSYLEEDYQKVIDNWKYFLLGDEPDMTKSHVKTRVNNISSTAASRQSSMNRSSDATSLWGAAYELSSDLGVEYGKIWDMARAYGTKGHSLYKDATLKEDIIYALDWMYENRYGQTQIDADKDENVETWRDIRIHNWWDWFVDAPTKLVDIMMVMSDDLTDEQIEKYFSLYDYICTFMRTNLNSDANVNSRAYARFGADVLMGNDIGVKTLMDAYPILFAYATSGTGMYEDYSYIKHNMIPYTGVYGTGALLDRIVKIMAITDGTMFELPQKYIKTYTGWIFNAFEPLMIDCGIMSMVRGRGVDGSSELSDGVSVIQSVLNMIDAVDAGDAYKLKTMIKRHLAENNIYSSLTLPQMAKLEEILSDTSIPEPEPYLNTRIYYNMDRTVHHKADWSAGLAIHSERTGNYESINYQNENGWYTSDGMLYLYTDKNQYDTSYFRYADPYKRPGTTVDSQERQLVSVVSGLEYFSSKDFAGGVTLDNSYATVAMDLESFHNETYSENIVDTGGGGAQPLHDCDLTAKKSWYLFDDEIVCLGSDITATADFDVYTTVENRKVTTNALSVNGNAVEYGTEGETAEPVYAHIEGTGGYYFPQGGNLSYRQVTNNSKFFELWLNHGKAPTAQSYAYAVLPGKTLAETAEYVQNPSFEILSNTSSVQAVHHTGLNMTGYTFWTAGTFDGVTVSAPCTLMMADAEGKMTLALSDPTFKLDELVVTLDGEYELTSCDSKLSVAVADGKTVITANLSKVDGATLEAVFVDEDVIVPPAEDEVMTDYGRVLLFADHEDGKLGAGFEYQDVTTDNVKSGDTTVIGADRGYYVDICSDGAAIDGIYRPTYGRTTSPIQATGVTMADLDKMQVSLDICPVIPYNFNIRFYDKWSGTTTKGETLVTVKKDGKLAFANTDITYTYTAKTWMEIDTFLDFTADTYSVYIDGKLIVEDAPLKVLTECCESVGVTTGKVSEGTTLSMYVDNFRIAIPSTEG